MVRAPVTKFQMLLVKAWRELDAARCSARV